MFHHIYFFNSHKFLHILLKLIQIFADLFTLKKISKRFLVPSFFKLGMYGLHMQSSESLKRICLECRVIMNQFYLQRIFICTSTYTNPHHGDYRCYNPIPNIRYFPNATSAKPKKPLMLCQVLIIIQEIWYAIFIVFRSFQVALYMVKTYKMST